ncbi:p74 [Lambdina fiscellaria nucleopolyhedrovirus]|uniref:p74 n=1 Tax=Lambdina fiscellaria nucleopolyhedrovirus TaxID=1642929 RepID=A0A0E3Z6U7_9ABAC|nr:p74 [Lambdina fiscellaria nucleopolyhedrovirus]AKC91747.1 p74 [Lambdina fiscellaria nucleopolyhedrovirus]
MATLTAVDLTNASKYATHQHRLAFVSRWRSRLPHILIDYELRPATNDDFYVPSGLAQKALAVKLTFSKRGCDSMSCYPFTETNTINAYTPFGYTQTSDTTVAYAQPACYNLDRAAATREGAENEVQSAEFRYTDNNKCIMMDTISKMYFNSPYLRTEEHLLRGVDDVPGFNVTPNPDPLFPEKYIGTFNNAYCRRFGRELSNGGCSMSWWETLLGFVLGDSIYVTFKVLFSSVLLDLFLFSYTRPSRDLPVKPTADHVRVLQEWRAIRDTKIDVDFETRMLNYQTFADLGMDDKTALVYTAEIGFSRRLVTRTLNFRKATRTAADYDNKTRNSNDATANNDNNYLNADDIDQELIDIINDFMKDSILVSLWVSAGFDNVLTALKFMLKKINSFLIPQLKRALITGSKKITVKLLGETYKAAVVHTINRVAFKAVTAVAKAMTRIAIKAASVVGIVLILLSLGDLVLMFWDPLGYANMFPKEFPDDMSNSFLSAFFESMGETLDIVEFLPEFFDEFVEEDDNAAFDSLLHILDYVSVLEVNSNGQMLNFEQSEEINDFDESTLVGNALASSALYTRFEFEAFTERHNAAVFHNRQNNVHNIANGVAVVLFVFAAFLVYVSNEPDYRFGLLFAAFIFMALYLLIADSLTYFLKMRKHVEREQTIWFKNLYNF